jgi:hypothetical protein
MFNALETSDLKNPIKTTHLQINHCQNQPKTQTNISTVVKSWYPCTKLPDFITQMTTIGMFNALETSDLKNPIKTTHLEINHRQNQPKTQTNISTVVTTAHSSPTGQWTY